MQATDGYFDGSEGRVFYRAWLPEGEVRRILLLVHGYAEHSARYAHVAAALTPRGTALYAEDHLGHGHSDGERALITDFEHIVADLHTLAGIARAAHPGVPMLIAGHSMGGLLSSRFTQTWPDEVSGLILLGAVVGDWNWAREVLRDPEMPEPPDTWEGMSRDPQTVHEYATDPLVYRDRYKRPLLEAEVVALDRFNAEIDRVTAPVLFLHGEDDPFVDYRTSMAAAKAFPTRDLTVRVYPGARHELVNELNRDEVIDAIATFVERIAP
jgi:alpha-beta hydrolase superfamily lysophospholipase